MGDTEGWYFLLNIPSILLLDKDIVFQCFFASDCATLHLIYFTLLLLYFACFTLLFFTPLGSGRWQ